MVQTNSVSHVRRLPRLPTAAATPSLGTPRAAGSKEGSPIPTAGDHQNFGAWCRDLGQAVQHAVSVLGPVPTRPQASHAVADGVAGFLEAHPCPLPREQDSMAAQISALQEIWRGQVEALPSGRELAVEAAGAVQDAATAVFIAPAAQPAD